MATCPLCALASGASWSSNVPPKQEAQTTKDTKQTKTGIRELVIRRLNSMLLFSCISSLSWFQFLESMLRSGRVQILLRLRRHIPGIRPEAQVNGPPIVARVHLHQSGEELVEVQL